MIPLRVTIDGESHELHPYNSAIFLFAKEFSNHNHLFIQTGEEAGIYVFGRQQILNRLMNTGRMVVHYLPYVPDPDIAAYQQYLDSKQQPEEAPPLTEEEVAYYAKEFEGRINWDELEGGEQ